MKEAHMNTKQRVAAINAFIDAKHEADALKDTLAAVIGMAPECKLNSVLDKLEHVACEATSVAIGDAASGDGSTFTWLAWYVYDNECGARGLQASVGKGARLRKIDTVEKLVRVIEQDISASGKDAA